MKFYEDKENENYKLYKQELEQKYEEKIRPEKEEIFADYGKYSFSNFVNGRLVKEAHNDLIKDGLDTVIGMCEMTLDDEDFKGESDPDTITRVYKNLSQYKLDLKYYNNKEDPKYQKYLEVNEKEYEATKQTKKFGIKTS